MKVCVVGCERSGTSAVSSLLSLGSGYSLLDDPPESWQSYPRIYGQGHGLSFKLWWNIRKSDIVKVPGFATILPFLKKRFVGNFSTLYCIRDPRDVVASVIERLEQGGFSPLFTDVTWLGVHVRDRVEAISWRWRMYLECALRYLSGGGKVVFLKYEDFFDDRLGTLVKCTERLSIRFSSAKVRPFLEVQFRKGWDNTIRGAGRWQNDLDDLDVQKTIRICGDLMRTWGYEY
jgi:hypothetical protein